MDCVFAKRLVVSNVTNYFDKFSEWFMKLRECCTRYSKYQLLFPNSLRLQTALCKYYAAIVKSCQHAVEVFQNNAAFPSSFYGLQLRVVLGILQTAKAIVIPFEREFGALQVELRNKNQEVEEEIRFASYQAAHREQRLEDLERKQAGIFRSKQSEDRKHARE